MILNTQKFQMNVPGPCFCHGPSICQGEKLMKQESLFHLTEEEAEVRCGGCLLEATGLGLLDSRASALDTGI